LHAISHAHPVLFYLILLIILVLGKELWNSSLCGFLQHPITSSFFGRNILSFLFSHTLRLCFSLNVRDEVPHPYKTTRKFIVLYILIFMFLGRLGDKRFWAEL
jgi:hypothetical protein